MIRMAQIACGLLQADDQNRFRRNTETALKRLQSSVDGLVAAPLHEGLGRLQQLPAAKEDRRRSLLEEARAKFMDAAAREGTSPTLRANACALAAMCWAALQEPELAAIQLAQAEALAATALAAEHHAVRSGYASEDDVMWKRLDSAEQLVLDVRQLDDLLQGRAHLETRSSVPARPERAIEAPLPAGRPAPKSSSCDFLGGLGPRALGAHWHRLRNMLDDDEEPRWFSEATDLRLLCTSRSLIVYKPESFRLNGKPRFHRLLVETSIAQEGREWFDSFFILRAKQPFAEIRVNLGPARHARTVGTRLRQSLREAEEASQ